MCILGGPGCKGTCFLTTTTQGMKGRLLQKTVSMISILNTAEMMMALRS